MAASITWLGHATVQLTLPDERVIIIDPWLTENPGCPDHLKNPERCDMILVTHGHFDHVDDVGQLVERFNPMIVGNLELCSALEKRIGKGRYSGMNTGGAQTIGGVRVSLTQAFHSSAVDSPDGPIYAGMPNGLIVGADGLATIYHAGDTDVFSDMKLIAKLFAPQVCILPIGDHFTMGAAGAAMAAEFLQPAVIIPVHFGTFPVLTQTTEDFRNALSDELKSCVREIDVGQALPWTDAGIG